MLHSIRPTLILVVLLLTGVGSVAHAQFPDLINISAGYTPPSDMQDFEGAESQLARYDATLNMPIVLGERSFLIPGVAYHVDSVSFTGVPDDFVELRAFHSLSVPLLYVQLLPKSWSLAVLLQTGLAGDNVRVDGDHLRLTGMLLASRAPNERLTYGFGLLGSYSFGEFLPLPGVLLNYQFNSWLRMETFLPAMIDLKFLVADRLEIGPAFFVEGNEYAIRDSRIQDTIVCSDPSLREEFCIDHIAYSVGNAGLRSSLRVTGPLWFSLFTGSTVFRRFEPRNEDDRLTGDGVQDLPHTFLIQASLALRLPSGAEDDEETESAIARR